MKRRWSMPHAMLGWSWFVATLGFIACSLALRPFRPLRWVTAVALGWLILAFSMTPPFSARLHKTATPEKLEAQNRAIVTLPGLVGNTGLAHVRHIYAVAEPNADEPGLRSLRRALGGDGARARAWRGPTREDLPRGGRDLSLFQLLTNHSGAVRLDKYICPSRRTYATGSRLRSCPAALAPRARTAPPGCGSDGRWAVACVRLRHPHLPDVGHGASADAPSPCRSPCR